MLLTPTTGAAVAISGMIAYLWANPPVSVYQVRSVDIGFGLAQHGGDGGVSLTRLSHYAMAKRSQAKTSAQAVNNLLHLDEKQVEKCVDAYHFFQDKPYGKTDVDTEGETEHVRAYYTIINEVLALADIEKM